MTNTLRSRVVRRAASTAVATSAVVLAATPAYAFIAPEEPVAGSSTSQRTEQRGKAQIEHDERMAGSNGVQPQVKAKIEAMERAQLEPQPASGAARESSDPAGPSSTPIAVWLLLGGGLVTGAAGYTVYRFRHDGPVRAATA
jgi:hypothetical protein